MKRTPQPAQNLGAHEFPLDGLPNCDISAVIHEGLTAHTGDGRPARLAVVDENGRIVAAGDDVARQAWNAAINSYRQFMIGMGHIRVHTKPTGITSK